MGPGQRALECEHGPSSAPILANRSEFASIGPPGIAAVVATLAVNVETQSIIWKICTSALVIELMQIKFVKFSKTLAKLSF